VHESRDNDSDRLAKIEQTLSKLVENTPPKLINKKLDRAFNLTTMPYSICDIPIHVETLESNKEHKVSYSTIVALTKSLKEFNIKTIEELNIHRFDILNIFRQCKMLDIIEGREIPTESERNTALSLVIAPFNPKIRNIYIRQIMDIPNANPHAAWTMLLQGFQQLSGVALFSAYNKLHQLKYNDLSTPVQDVLDEIHQQITIIKDCGQELQEILLCAFLAPIFGVKTCPLYEAYVAISQIHEGKFYKQCAELSSAYYSLQLSNSMTKPKKEITLVTKENTSSSTKTESTNVVQSNKRKFNNARENNKSNQRSRGRNNNKSYNNNTNNNKSHNNGNNNHTSNYHQNNYNNNPRNQGRGNFGGRPFRGGRFGGRGYYNYQAANYTSNYHPATGPIPNYDPHFNGYYNGPPPNHGYNYPQGNVALNRNGQLDISSAAFNNSNINLHRSVYSESLFKTLTLNTTSQPMDLLDSGSTSTHTPMFDRLENIKTMPIKHVQIADGSIIKTTGLAGTIGNISEVNYNPNFSHTLVSVGALSRQGYTTVIDDTGANIYDKEAFVPPDIEKLGFAEHRDGLYYTQLENIKPSRRLLRNQTTNENVMVASLHSSDSYVKWHARLHLPKQAMLKLKRLQTITNFDINTNDIKKDHTSCIHCLKSKTDRQLKDYSYPLGKPAECVGGLIVTDVESYPIEGINNKKYIVGFIDIYSDFKYLYYLNTKDEVSEALELYITMLESYGHKIKWIHSDNGGENIGESDENKFRNICRNNRILYTVTPPYTPEANRRMERYWRTLNDGINTRLTDSNLPKYLWPYAAEYTNYIWNRIKVVEKSGNYHSPYELFTNIKPDISHLRRWGCLVSMHIPKSTRKKLELKAHIGYFLGYESISKCAIIYLPGKGIRKSADCIFDEHLVYGDPYDPTKVNIDREILNENTNILPVQITDEIEAEYDSDNDEQTYYISDVIKETEHIPYQKVDLSNNTINLMNPFDNNTTTTIRNRKSIDLSFATLNIIEETVEDSTHDSFLTVELVLKTVDMTPEVALHDPRWRASMNEEIRAIMANNTWVIEELPEGKHTLKTKWIFAEKYDDNQILLKLKSRLTVKGFAQIAGIDYDLIFSPVVKLVTIRLLLALASLYNLVLYQMDVDTAFLNAEIGPDEPAVYLEPMIGYDFEGECRKLGLNPQNKRLKLRLLKALYGLKQSPRAWFKTIDAFMISEGFTSLLSDVCIYTKTYQEMKIIMAIYVDDMIIAVNNIQFWNEFKYKLMNRFKMKDLGELKWILGIRITRNENDIRIDQELYLTNVISKYLPKNTKPRNVPISSSNIKHLEDYYKMLDETIKFNINDIPAKKRHLYTELNTRDHSIYRQIVGSLMYAMVATRPDIAFSLSILSRFLHKPIKLHLQLAIYVLRYLKGSLTQSIVYSKYSDNIEIIGLTDADWGGCYNTRRSMTGYIYFLAGGAISWKSMRQNSITLSSQQAEYYSLSESIREAVWYRSILTELGYTPLNPTVILEDNKGAKAIAENPVSSSRNKHYQIKYHWIREVISLKQISIKYIETLLNIADMLTKALDLPKFQFLVNALFKFTIEWFKNNKSKLQLYNIDEYENYDNESDDDYNDDINMSVLNLIDSIKKMN